MKVALIPCGLTEWREQGRLLGRVELTLATDGAAQCSAWSEELRPALLDRIFHAPDELSRTTAQLVSRQLNIPAKALDGLVEVDLGLWAGLTEEQLKSRYSTAHRQLVDSPLNVSPPKGEDFSDAFARLQVCLRKRIKPNGRGGIGLVMRPFAFAMACHALGGAGAAQIWETSQNRDELIVMDYTGEVPALICDA